jgi:hypothetical protein
MVALRREPGHAGVNTRLLEQRIGIGLTMSEQLKWTEGLQHHASRDKAHYVIHERSDGKWDVAVYCLFTDQPDATEELLGNYLLETQADAKELAQALADTRGRARQALRAQGLDPDEAIVTF